MSRALILGGTGAIGLATARRLLAAGWQVDLTGREPAHLPADVAAAGATFVAADRAVPGELRAAFGGGADLLVDQIIASAVTLVYSFVVSFIIAKVIDLVIGLRVDNAAEEEGLDLSQHAERAYAGSASS